MTTTRKLVLPATRPWSRVRRGVLIAGLVVALVLAFLWFIGVLGGNVREVQVGRLYRSAQLSGSNLKVALQTYGIRSVVNLRGASERASYHSEQEVCLEMGVAHYDISLSSRHLPEPMELRKLFAAFDAAPRPVMVHCEGGSDRAGLASTLYENAYEGVPLDRAESDQLTWRYGHFAFFGSWPMDRFFDLYRQTRHGQDLRTWSLRTYPSVYAREEGTS